MPTHTSVAPASVNGKLFDASPLVLGGGHFRFGATGVRVTGTPDLAEWTEAWTFATGAMEVSPYWVGTLLVYADTREDWAEALDQAVAVTGLSESSLRNLRWMARNVPAENFAVAPSPAHAQAVAALPVEEQARWLKEARDEGLTRREMEAHIRAARRRRVVEGQAVMVGQYRIIYADPPWEYDDADYRNRAAAHYPTMSIEELCQLPVAAHATKDAVLFMWATAPILLQLPGPREVGEAWGFRYKSNQTWDKVLGMPGRFFQVQHEHLLVFERGVCPPDVPTPKPKSVFTERRTAHSTKPAAVRMMIERMFTTGPYLELFARDTAEGWDAYGNDARLWGA